MTEDTSKNNPNISRETVPNNIADFLGVPNSVKENLQVESLDMTLVNEQNQRDIFIEGEAKRIYNLGDSLKYMVRSCQKTHVGDGNALAAMLLSFAGAHVLNGKGIHVAITGKAGSGKSDAIRTAKNHIPPEYVYQGRISDKALFYFELKAGQVIVIDDQKLSETMQETIKNATSDNSEPYTYMTLGKDNKPLLLSIPPRCAFWISKVNQNGDEQIGDRMLKFWSDESSEQAARIREAQNAAAISPDITEDTTTRDISREIWKQMDANTVSIPFAKDILCDDYENARDYNLMLSLVQAAAIMAAPQRNRDEHGWIEASISDFQTAALIMNPLIENRGGSQKLSLTRNESNLLNFMESQPTGTYPYRFLTSSTNLNNSELSHALNGRTNEGDDVGLFGKCPAITPSTQTTGDLRQKSIFWDKEAYKNWRKTALGLFAMNPEKEMYWAAYEESKKKNQKNDINPHSLQ